MFKWILTFTLSESSADFMLSLSTVEVLKLFRSDACLSQQTCGSFQFANKLTSVGIRMFNFFFY